MSLIRIKRNLEQFIERSALLPAREHLINSIAQPAQIAPLGQEFHRIFVQTHFVIGAAKIGEQFVESLDRFIPQRAVGFNQRCDLDFHIARHLAAATEHKLPANAVAQPDFRERRTVSVSQS